MIGAIRKIQIPLEFSEIREAILPTPPFDA
jgi:hypothetical protein